MKADEIYLHVHNARSLLNLVLRTDVDDDIYFALEKINEELQKAEEGAEHLQLG